MRYLAPELGPKQTLVNAISAGSVRTRAAADITHLDEIHVESGLHVAGMVFH